MHSPRATADRDQVVAIYAPIQERLEKVEQRLTELAGVKFPFLSRMLTHVYGSTGKRARPAITLPGRQLSPSRRVQVRGDGDSR